METVQIRTSTDKSCNTQDAPPRKRRRTESVWRSRDHFEDLYEVQDVFAKGGFGMVCAGRRRADNTPVAVKFINKCQVKYINVVMNGEECRTIKEAALMVRGGRRSNFVVSLLDLFDLKHQAILIMERPTCAIDLHTYRKERGHLTEDQTKNILRQTVSALVHIHANGVFHRDIKEKNILVLSNSTSPRIKIIDFGCSCLVSEEPYQPGMFAGTPSFAPPEVLWHEEYNSGPTTVWQLGAMMWQLTSYYRGFSTKKFLEGSLKHIRDLSDVGMDFLNLCLLVDEDHRATLKELQRHPWLKL
ncbi:serine/threonine-protein kinase pim-2-like [Synchiropus picturatus]